VAEFHGRECWNRGLNTFCIMFIYADW
jgi:hypothetical protein